MKVCIIFRLSSDDLLSNVFFSSSESTSSSFWKDPWGRSLCLCRVLTRYGTIQAIPTWGMVWSRLFKHEGMVWSMLSQHKVWYSLDWSGIPAWGMVVPGMIQVSWHEVWYSLVWDPCYPNMRYGMIRAIQMRYGMIHAIQMRYGMIHAIQKWGMVWSLLSQHSLTLVFLSHWFFYQIFSKDCDIWLWFYQKETTAVLV